VTAITVGVEIKHSYQGDLIVELVSPSGRSATLHSLSGGSKDDLRTSYDSASTPSLAALAGEAIQGNWTLRVRDTATIDTGVLERWTLTLRS
jgi:subtilisin-like proprotein convertase family protein